MTLPASIISFDGAGYVDSDNAAQAPAADDNTAATVDAEAPADTTAPADTAATTEKGSPDTGVEGIAAAAGVAVVAARRSSPLQEEKVI